MALKCRIVKGKVLAPNNKESILYSRLLDKYTGDKALQMYALTETDEYKDLVPRRKDSNGEMLLDEFLNFALQKNSNTDFSQETLDLQFRIGVKGLEDLKKKLKSQGLVDISKRSLESAGVFTLDEVEYILSNEGVINNLTDFINNTEVQNTEKLEDDYLTLSSEYNSIGIKPYENPSTVKENVLKVISKANTPAEVSELIPNIEYPSLVEKFNTNPSFRSRVINDALNHKEVSVFYDNNYPKELLTNTLDVSNNEQLRNSTIQTLSNTNQDIIRRNFLDSVDIFKGSGIDLNLDTFEVLNLSTDKINKISESILNFTETTNESTISDLANSLRPFLNLENTKIVNTSNLDSKVNNIIYSETLKEEVELFEESGLVKHSSNLYQKIDDKYNSEELYEILYDKAISGELDLNLQSVNQLQLQEPLNKETVLTEIKDIINQQTKFLPKGDQETLKKLAVYKLFYGAFSTTPIAKSPVTEIPNREYLETDFVSDFSKFLNYNKARNTDIYKSFLRFFKVTNKGIELVDQSEFTKEHIKNNSNQIESIILKDLVNYSFLSKNLDLGLTQQVNPQNHTKLDLQRLQVIQNGTSNKYLGDYKHITDNSILVEGKSDNFISVAGENYEKTMTLKGVSVYSKLPLPSKLYNTTEVSRPQPDLSTEDLLEYITKEQQDASPNNIIGTIQLEQVNQEFFEC